ncbi:hypothetical protein ALQ88_05718, partial [Pseudomonas savastanoi]
MIIRQLLFCRYGHRMTDHTTIIKRFTMRNILLLAAAVGCSFGLPAQAATFAYISSPTDGLISQYRLDEQSGALSLV